MSKVIRISDETEEFLKEYKQVVADELLMGEGTQAFVSKIQSDNYAIQCALVQAINHEVNYLREKGIDYVIKKE